MEGAPLRVGVSPIAYCHPELWPTKNQIQYEQYITELAMFVSRVLQGGDSVWLFSSSSPDDQLFTDLYRRLDPALDPAARDRLFSIAVNTLRELLEGLLLRRLSCSQSSPWPVVIVPFRKAGPCHFL